MTPKPPAGFSSECALAINASYLGGFRILSYYQVGTAIENKADGSPVTLADKESEKVITETLEAGSSFSILGEESDLIVRSDVDTFWIVDPLDGTKDFIAKTDEFAVHIALCKNGEIVCAVVYAPATNTWCVAEKGKGAWQKEKDGAWIQMLVSSLTDSKQLRYVVSRHHLSADERKFLHFLGAENYVQKGGAGIKMTDVAAGRFDAYINLSPYLKLWDTAPGVCIVQEAGGRVTDMKGKPMRYDLSVIVHDCGMLVSNGHVHNMLLDAYKNY